MAANDRKTEKPTPRRLMKAREEGNFPSARTFVGALQFLAFVALLHFEGPRWMRQMQDGFASLIAMALNPRQSASDVVYRGFGTVRRLMLPVGVMGLVMIGITVAVQLLVTGFGVSLKKLTPDFKRLDPLAHLKNLPKQNLPALLQAAVMIPVFGLVVYYLVASHLGAFLALPLTNLVSGTGLVWASIESLLWKASGLFVVFGLVDLLRQKSRYQGELKMSKQDIKDEMKELDGNPVVKQRIRRIRRDLARRRMMKEVATATAVVVNPTHYAVALKYSLESKGAPMVVAKGKNYLALRIRQRALENQVPLIENPPLAQGLYKSVEVGQEIPAQFYKAVAEVLAYIYRVMNGRRPV
jgi:flagellar biosynthetic protein FlhB